MAANERKRQEKLARKAADRKQRLRSVKAAMSKTSAVLSDTRQMLRLAEAPIYECLVPEELFELGIGNVVVSRKMASGDIAVATFLLDVYCLGVKDTLFKVVSEGEYQAMLRHLGGSATFESIDPACARKLVEGAVAFARDLGFSPHPDYRVSKMIFGDIDPSTCPTEFGFGKDGKPLYVSGPYDSLHKSRAIIDLLTRRCGPDGFHYLVAVPGPEGEELDDSDDLALP